LAQAKHERSTDALGQCSDRRELLVWSVVRGVKSNLKRDGFDECGMFAIPRARESTCQGKRGALFYAKYILITERSQWDAVLNRLISVCGKPHRYSITSRLGRIGGIVFGTLEVDGQIEFCRLLLD
jgi:hypothetical protein